MNAKLLGLIVSLALIGPAEASSITYNVAIYESTNFRQTANFSITGTITTDGTIGALSNSDVTGYNLTVGGVPGYGAISVECSTGCSPNISGGMA